VKNLTAFIDQHNFHASIFGGRQMDVKNLTAADRQKLLDDLECALSPENLCCDGELSGPALQRKSRQLNGALRELKALRK